MNQAKKRKVNPQKKTRRNLKDKRVVNSRGSTGFPDSEIATIRYSDQIVLTGTLYAQHAFRGNSAFDPDETGIGHQPMYFDQYAAVYSKYKVIGSTMTVACSNYDATRSASVVLSPSSDVPTLTSYALAMEQPYAKRTELIPVSTRQGSQSTVRSGITTRKILGLSAAQFASEDYSAVTSATPSSVWYWIISAFDTNSVGMECNVDMTFKILFYDRRAPALSRSLKVVKSPEEQAKKKQVGELPPAFNYVSPVDPPTKVKRTFSI